MTEKCYGCLENEATENDDFGAPLCVSCADKLRLINSVISGILGNEDEGKGYLG